MSPSNIMSVAWSCSSTVVHCNCPSTNPTVVSVAYYSSVIPSLTLSHFLITPQCSTGSSLSCAKSSAISWPMPPKPNTDTSFSIYNKPFPSKQHSLKWTTPSPPLPFRLTIPQMLDSPTVSLRKNDIKPWICVSIGYMIESSKNRSMYTGDQYQPT